MKLSTFVFFVMLDSFTSTMKYGSAVLFTFNETNSQTFCAEVIRSLRFAQETSNNKTTRSSWDVNVLFTSSVEFTDTCELYEDSIEVEGRNETEEDRAIYAPSITIQCEKNVVLTCGRNNVCIKLLSTFNLTIHGCTLHGAGIEVTVPAHLSNLTLIGCVLDGLRRALPINVWTAQYVTILDSRLSRGYQKGTWMCGGCLSLRGVRRGIVLRNVSVDDCTNSRDGGCVCITGDNSSDVRDRFLFPYETYGGTVEITDSSFENCVSTISGLLYVSYMQSAIVTSSGFYNGTARSYEGCVGIGYIYPGLITFVQNTIRLCRVVANDNGCASFSTRGIPPNAPNLGFAQLGNVTMKDCVFSDCTAAISVGGMSVFNTNRFVHVENVLVENTMAVVKGGGVEFYDLDHPVMVRNLTVRHTSTLGDGGGIRIIDVSSIIFDGVKLYNTSGTVGGGLYSSFGVITILSYSMRNVQSFNGSCLLAHFSTIKYSTKSGGLSMLCLPSKANAVSRHYVPKRYFESEGFASSLNGSLTITERSFAEPTYTQSLVSSRGSSSTSNGNTSSNNVTITTSIQRTAGEQGILAGIATAQIGVMGTSKGEGSMILTSAWLGMLMYDCNKYKPSSLEIAISPSFSDHPRVLNLYINLVILTSCAALEALWTHFRLKQNEQIAYTDLSHPSISLRFFLLYVIDVTAAAVCCFAPVVGKWWLGLLSLLFVVGIMITLYNKYIGPAQSGQCAGCYVSWTPPAIGCVGILLNNAGLWSDTEKSEGVVRKGGILFEEFTQRRAWAGMVSLGVSFVQGILSGVPLTTRSQCAAMYWVSTVMYATIIVLYSLVPVHHTRRDHFAFRFVLLALVFGNAIRALGYSVHGGAISSDTVNGLVQACVVIGVIMNVVSSIGIVFGQRKGLHAPPSFATMMSESDSDAVRTSPTAKKSTHNDELMVEEVLMTALFDSAKVNNTNNSMRIDTTHSGIARTLPTSHTLLSGTYKVESTLMMSKHDTAILNKRKMIEL
eukprot:PhF_6_TR978/c0_g1_i1/m.1893